MEVDPSNFEKMLEDIYRTGGNCEWSADVFDDSLGHLCLHTTRVLNGKARDDTFPLVDGGCASDYAMHRTAIGHRLACARVLRALTPIRDTFDALYVTGLSGMLPASVVAFLLNKKLLVLRKVNNGSNGSHGMNLEGVKDCAGSRLVIVDDFVSRGHTLRRLMAAKPDDCTLAGLVFYGAPQNDDEDKDGYRWCVDVKDDETFESPITKRWHVKRRGHGSMMFDLVPEGA